MANKIVYIHIGTPKTGTTTIQHHFFENRAWYESHGLYYPTSGIPKNSERGHHLLAEGLLWNQKNKIGEWTKLKDEITKINQNKILLSSEMFSFLIINNISEIRKLLDTEVKIMIYFRNHLDLIFSGYKQEIKVGSFYGTIEEYSKKIFHLLDYNLLVTNWSQVFGKENVVVCLFEPLKKENRILGNFEEILFGDAINTCVFNQRQNQKNLSLSSSLIYALNKLNKWKSKYPRFSSTVDKIRIKLIYDTRVQRMASFLFNQLSERWLTHEKKSFFDSELFEKVEKLSDCFIQSHVPGKYSDLYKVTR